MAPCPNPETLREYALGLCGDATSEVVEEHVAECAQCDSSLLEWDGASDSLLRTLPLAAGDVPDASAPAWLDRLRRQRPDEPKAEVLSTPPPELSGYRLLEELGRGGMSVVHRAHHEGLDRDVAIKFLHPRFLVAAAVRRRFEREIKLLGALRHPGIVMATDAGRCPRGDYLVMELVDGVDLSRLVRRGGPLSVPEAADVGKQMAEALVAAHQAGAIHRDIKPSNVMLGADGTVKLLDFGLAHWSDAVATQETSIGQLLGTLGFLAPEQARGHAAQPQTDLFGLGATLLYLLTGQAPHETQVEDANWLLALRAVSDWHPPRLRELRADVPVAFDQLVQRLLAANPTDRPASAEDVAAELAPWCQGDSRSNLAERAIEASCVAEASPSPSVPLCINAPPTDSAAEPPVTEPPAADGRKAPGAPVWPPLAWLAAGGLVASLAWGILLMLPSAEGTLVVESDVEDIQVELVDAADAVQGLTIDRGWNTTRLRAGRYRIRLAEGYDHAVLDQQVLELQRKGTVVARITSRRPLAATPANGRVYDGKTQQAWQEVLDREYSWERRADAAAALILFASSLPDQARCEQLMRLSAAVSRSDPAATERNGAAAKRLRQRLADELLDLPPKLVVETFVKTFPAGGNESCTLALDVMQQSDVRKYLFRDPQAAEVLLAWLPHWRRPSEAASRTTLLCTFLDAAPQATRQAYREPLVSFATQLLTLPAGETREAIAILLQHAGAIGLPPDIACQLIGRELQDRPESALRQRFQLLWFGAEFPYGDAWHTHAREQMDYFISEWVPYLNREFRAGTHRPAHLQSLDYVTRVAFDGDDWAFSETAQHVRQELAKFYREGAEPPVRVTPELLLTQLLRMTGEVPDFVRQAAPTNAQAVERLGRFEAALRSGSKLGSSGPRYQGLVTEAPYLSIRLALTRGEDSPRQLLSIIGPQREAEAPPMDPLLILAVAVDVAGTSDAQDDRLASLFNEGHPSRTFRRHLNDLLAGPYLARLNARRLLQELARRAKSAELTKALQSVDPLLRPQQPSNPSGAE